MVLCVLACKEVEKAAPAPVQQKPVSSLLNPEMQSSVILRVEETDYTNADFIQYLKITAGEDFETLSPASLSRLYDDFVNEKILLEGAKKAEISLSEQEKLDYLDRMERGEASGGSGEPMSEQEIRSFFDRLLIEKYTSSLVKKIAVSKDEIRSYYAANKRRFLRSERVKVSQILCRTESEAVHILRQVKAADEAAFRQLAREKSVGAEAARGGEMGVFEMNQLPLEMEKVIFSLKEGEVSDVLESMYGYHIFRLDKKFDAQLVAEDKARAEIRSILMDQKTGKVIQDRLQELKTAIAWKENTGNLTFPYQRIQNG